MFGSRKTYLQVLPATALLMLIITGCSTPNSTKPCLRQANYLVVDPGTASMMKAPGICYFAQHYPDYRDISGAVFVGQTLRLLNEEETAFFREKNCFDGYTGCWYYPVVEMRVEEVLKGEIKTGDSVYLMLAPLRTNEAIKQYLDERLVVFARRFSDDSATDLFTNFQATYFLKGGYALATSEDGMNYDFGTSAISEADFLTYVQNELSGLPDNCAWNEFARLRSLPSIQESGDK